MDVISLGKAMKTLREISDLNKNIVGKGAESHFKTVDHRLDWIEGQADKMMAEGSKRVDLSVGQFKDVENYDNKLLLKTAGTTFGGYTDVNIIPEMSGYKNENITVSASGEYGGRPSWRAFNSVLNNIDYWMLKFDTLNDNWLKVDLGEEKIINKYRLSDYQINAVIAEYMPTSWEFQGSLDDENWISLDKQSNIRWSEDDVKTFEISNSEYYRYYRILLLDMKASTYVGVGRLELFEVGRIDTYATLGTWESPIIDLGVGWKETNAIEILGKDVLSKVGTKDEGIVPIMNGYVVDGVTVSADNTYSSNYPWKAFDGDSTTYWYSNRTAPEGGHWVKVDLGENKKHSVHEITLKTEKVSGDKHGIKDWVLFGSNDDITYVEVSRGTQENNNLLQRYSFDNKESYRYYRINILNSHYSTTPTYAVISEMKLFGEETGIAVYMACSTDGKTFTEYEIYREGNLPQARYIKIRATFSSAGSGGEEKVFDFDQSDEQNTLALNEFVEANGKLQLKTTYESTNSAPTPVGDGLIFEHIIDKSKFKRIEKVEVK